MPDPQTTNLGLYVPLNGADIGTWDVPANANFTLLDTVLGGNVSIALTNVPITLSSAQYNCIFIQLTGVLTGNVTLTFPALGRVWVVRNATTGNFVVTARTAAVGATATVPSGTGVLVSDATNIYALSSYQTGTWTPTLTFGGGSTGLTYSTRVGRYTLNGNIVNFSVKITLSAKGSSAGVAVISGLPFTSAATYDSALSCWWTLGNLSGGHGGDMWALVPAGSASISMYQGNADTSPGNVTTVDSAYFNNTTSLVITGHYSV